MLAFLPVGELIYDALSKFQSTTRRTEIASQIREMFTDEDSPEKLSLMSQYLEMMDTDIEAETKNEDEDWFEGNTFLFYEFFILA